MFRYYGIGDLSMCTFYYMLYCIFILILPKFLKYVTDISFLTLFKKTAKNLLFQSAIISLQLLSMYMFCMYVHVCIHCPI